MDLTQIIDHGWPGAALRVRRWRAVYGTSEDPNQPPPLLDTVDMWAGIDAGDAAMQAALDWCVDWAAGVTPPTAAAVHAAIAAAEAEAASARLAAHREAALAETDRQAELARLRFITAGAGQAMAYEAKRREVSLWAADPAPDPAGYPWAASRAGRLAGIAPADVTVAQAQAVIDEWTARAGAWESAGIAIEEVREQAKEDIGAAPDAAVIASIVSGLAWPAP